MSSAVFWQLHPRSSLKTISGRRRRVLRWHVDVSVLLYLEYVQPRAFMDRLLVLFLAPLTFIILTSK